MAPSWQITKTSHGVTPWPTAPWPTTPSTPSPSRCVRAMEHSRSMNIVVPESTGAEPARRAVGRPGDEGSIPSPSARRSRRTTGNPGTRPPRAPTRGLPQQRPERTTWGHPEGVPGVDDAVGHVLAVIEGDDVILLAIRIVTPTRDLSPRRPGALLHVLPHGSAKLTSFDRCAPRSALSSLAPDPNLCSHSTRRKSCLAKR